MDYETRSRERERIEEDCYRQRSRNRFTKFLIPIFAWAIPVVVAMDRIGTNPYYEQVKPLVKQVALLETERSALEKIELSLTDNISETLKPYKDKLLPTITEARLVVTERCEDIRKDPVFQKYDARREFNQNYGPAITLGLMALGAVPASLWFFAANRKLGRERDEKLRKLDELAGESLQ